jgi:hypothetical protein
VTVELQPPPDGRFEPHSLVCSACSYGVARPVPPERCPMCGQSGAWRHSSRRPFGLAIVGTPGTAA